MCNFDYKDMTTWGRAMGVTPGVVVDGKLVTNDLVDINLGILHPLGSSFYDDWGGPGDVRGPGPPGQSRRPAPSLEPAHQPPAPEAGFRRQLQLGHVSAVVRRHRPPGPRHRGRPPARLWSTALSGLVNTDHLRATGSSVVIHLPNTALKPEVTLEWKIPQWSNTIERDRARTYFQAYAAAAALDFIEKALADVRNGKTKTWEPFDVPEEGIGAASPKPSVGCSPTTW